MGLIDYHFQWGVLGRYCGAFANATLMSLSLWLAAAAIGTGAGLALAYSASAKPRGLQRAARLCIDIARNTPLLLLVFFVFLALPQLGIRFLDRDASFVLALSAIASGYLAENLRANLASMPLSYFDGAKAIGLRWYQRQLYVVLPITLRQSLPAMTNSYIGLFKDTSVASLIAVHEITFVAREVNTNTFRVFEAWTAACVIYVAVCAALAWLARLVERRLPRWS